jgi:succinate dehydrogenase / fumarate reductase, cytochrome b subunit
MIIMENKNPLSPHLQIYRWHISSLVSISHRITGIINFVAVIFICIWAINLTFGETNYMLINSLLDSFFGKFIILGITWSFSFQILSEIRHLIMDLGYSFELKMTRISGLMVIFGSILLTIIIFISGKNLF